MQIELSDKAVFELENIMEKYQIKMSEEELKSFGEYLLTIGINSLKLKTRI